MLPTEFWVMAVVRQCNDNFTPAMVLHRGDPHRGTVLVRVSLLEPNGDCQLFSQTIDSEGQRAWLRRGKNGQPLSEDTATALIEKAIAQDPDIWVIEVEDPKGQNPFDGQII